MNKRLLVVLLVWVPLLAYATCDPVAYSFFDSIFIKIYDIFGDKLLKVCAVLYGVSLTFEVMRLIASQTVLLTTWTNKDNEFLERIYGNRLYKIFAAGARFFLRLRLPTKKK